MSYHRSILLKEILGFAKGAAEACVCPEKRGGSLDPAPFWILDGTLGDGGHSLALLKHIPEACLIGLDQDPAMLGRAKVRLEKAGLSPVLFEKKDLETLLALIRQERKKEERTKTMEDAALEPRALLLNENFLKAAELLEALQIRPHFILLDLGVSEFHFRSAGRGFSYLDENLDMRLDPALPQTARKILNSYPEENLKIIFRNYGEERFSGRIARAVVESRPIGSARELAAIVCKAVPVSRDNAQKRAKGKFRSSSHIHPATRVFQALRIEVNQELAVLEKALAELPLRLAPGGRMAVISFHSLEDRLVKRAFRNIGKKKPKKTERQNKKESYKHKKNYQTGEPEKEFYILTPKPIVPSPEEIASNPSARSAKLRVIERQAPLL